MAQVSDIYWCSFHWQLPALEVEEVLKGFSSEAVISIAGLLVLSVGLVRSGVVRWIMERLNDIIGEPQTVDLDEFPGPWYPVRFCERYCHRFVEEIFTMLAGVLK